MCLVAIVGIVAWNCGTPELGERIYLQVTHNWIEGYKRLTEATASLLVVVFCCVKSFSLYGCFKCMYIYLCTPSVLDAHRDQKKSSDFLRIRVTDGCESSCRR